MLNKKAGDKCQVNQAKYLKKTPTKTLVGAQLFCKLLLNQNRVISAPKAGFLPTLKLILHCII